MKKLMLSIFIFISFSFFAQNNTKKDSQYRRNPYWIEMIKSPNVNYFEAIKAYELFWEGKKKPLDEDEKIGEDKSGKSKDISFWEKREQRKEKKFQVKYSLECKKFEHWKMIVKPYVQEDGRILSPEEQLKLWKQQRN